MSNKKRKIKSKDRIIGDIQRMLTFYIKGNNARINKYEEYLNTPIQNIGLIDVKKGFSNNPLSSIFSDDLQTTSLKEDFLMDTKSKIDKLTMYKLKEQSILDAISLEGMTKVCYGLPRIITTIVTNNPFFLYLIVSGIKINGTNKSLDDELMDDIEKALLPLEKAMSRLIKDDLTIDFVNIWQFIVFYQEYIETYIKMISEENIIDFSSFDRNSCSLIFQYMEYYAFAFRSLTDFYPEPEKIQGKTIKFNPLDNYISENQIIKICDIDTFSRMLNESDLSKAEKEQYLAQMKLLIETNTELAKYIKDGKIIKACDLNVFQKLLARSLLPTQQKAEYYTKMQDFLKRIENEELNSKVEEIKAKNLDDKKRELYNKAKESGNSEALKIIRDIDSLIELLVDAKGYEEELHKECTLYFSYLEELFLKVLDDDSLALYKKAKESRNIEALNIIKAIDSLIELFVNASDEEKEELLKNCALYFSYLEEMFPSDTKKEVKELPKVLYYKNTSNKVSVVLEEIIKANKTNYKQIFNDLTKIFNGNIRNDKPIQGNKLSIPVYVKGKTFKIAYMIINGVTIIITGGMNEDAFKNILSVLNSREFLTYLKETEAKIKNNSIEDESDYTKSIIAELEKSEAVRKTRNFS